MIFAMDIQACSISRKHQLDAGLVTCFWEVPDDLDLEEVRRLAGDPEEYGVPNEHVEAYLKSVGGRRIRADHTLVIYDDGFELDPED